MKALTLTQPWATLVALGKKRIETRSWYTRYRGPLAIHAADRFPRDCALLCAEEPFSSALRSAGITGAGALARGYVLCSATLVACIGIDGDDSMNRELIGSWGIPTHPEMEFGNYGAGRFAWVFKDVARLPDPVRWKGALGLWEWPGMTQNG